MSLMDRNDLVASYYTLNGVAGPARVKPTRYSFEQRLSAARHAGFTGVGMTLESDQTLPPAALAEIAARQDVQVAELEFVGGWYLKGKEATEWREREEALYRYADAFGTRQLNAGIILPKGDGLDYAELGRMFGELCDRAGEHGLVVSLEPIWVFALDSPFQAADIVSRADRSNGGVLIDAYHLFRSEVTLEELAELDGGLINGVQLGDIPAGRLPDPVEENEHHRELPGEGAGDVVGLLSTLERMGVDVPIALEVMSDSLRAEPLEQAADHAYTTTRAAVDAARAARSADAATPRS